GGRALSGDPAGRRAVRGALERHLAVGPHAAHGRRAAAIHAELRPARPHQHVAARRVAGRGGVSGQRPVLPGVRKPAARAELTPDRARPHERRRPLDLGGPRSRAAVEAGELSDRGPGARGPARAPGGRDVTATLHDVLDVPVRSEPYHVEAAATIAYARAVNDRNPAHLEGRVAPPLFAVVPALKTLVRAKRLATDAFTLHGEHDIRFHRPIVPGMTLTVEARLVGVRATGAGTTLIVHGITRADDGAPVNEQYLVNIAHGRRLAEEAGTAAPDHRVPAEVRDVAPFARVAYDLDPDQTRRYAE